MIFSIIELIIILVGLGATAVLFFRFPRLPAYPAPPETPIAVSVIIPARNEEKNLEALLSDLARQSVRPLEIICADDGSEDRTAEVALARGARLLSIRDKPPEWTGKSWACQRGAEVSTGDLLLFLDADVRLGESGVSRLVAAQSASGGTISVQPYHNPRQSYEQLSLIFNFVQIAANGAALPWGEPAGLYGPVILISRADYLFLGCHNAVKSSIVEDMSLGLRLHALGLPFQAFIGDADISFRMYGGGLKSLLEGWTKNLAAGAAKTTLPVFLLVFFWISSLISVPLHLILAVCASSWTQVWLLGALYVIWTSVLLVLSKKIGRFAAWSKILFPLPLAAFLGIFVLSAVKRVFRLKARWKGRDIPVGGKPCD